ncbi:E3 SUMO-protein ligase ZBED1-like [Salvelinus namaycush]|uniref:E3 SUMO-protein ligase ZBED1-like n=1 Tax=Salvelinus namaycush TaxID=8040 RepID=A0A8U1C320_SALNM|nr:E3 SUMO-protein ligase ZBED1-like [Salvelinus namaycush]
MAEGSDSALEIFQPSKRTKSEVWSYFGFYKSAEGNLIEDGHPVCRTCNNNKITAKGDNTSNLLSHLHDQHPLLYSECKSGRLQSGRAAGKPSDATVPSSSTAGIQTLQQAFKRQAAYAPTSKNAQGLTAALSYYIAKDMMPFQIVEKPGFLRLMKVAVTHYKVPSQTLLSKTEIKDLNNQVKADVGKSLAQGTWFAATTDLWTSKSGGGQPYISFTIHYLTPDWQLESNCLELQFFPEDHSAHIIRGFFENMLEEWGINKKDLVCITTDNATNMIKAFEEFPDLWLGCFGHNLNLAISKALKIQG